MERQIYLNDIENIKNFVNDMTKLDAVVDVTHENYIVDGRSLLGILSLDLSKPVTAIIRTVNNDTVNKFNLICDKYSIGE